MAFKMRSSNKPSFKMMGSSPMKQDSIWSRAKKWGKENILDPISDASVNMSNIAGNDPETKAMHKAERDRIRQATIDMEKRHEDAAVKEKQLQDYEKMYMSDPISKQRDNESDDQYRRRMADLPKHKRRFAEGKYKDKLKADELAVEEKSLAMAPKTEEEAIAAAKNKKGVPYAKKKKY